MSMYDVELTVRLLVNEIYFQKIEKLMDWLIWYAGRELIKTSGQPGNMRYQMQVYIYCELLLPV